MSGLSPPLGGGGKTRRRLPSVWALDRVTAVKDGLGRSALFPAFMQGTGCFRLPIFFLCTVLRCRLKEERGKGSPMVNDTKHCPLCLSEIIAITLTQGWSRCRIDCQGCGDFEMDGPLVERMRRREQLSKSEIKHLPDLPAYIRRQNQVGKTPRLGEDWSTKIRRWKQRQPFMGTPRTRKPEAYGPIAVTSGEPEAGALRGNSLPSDSLPRLPLLHSRTRPR